MVRFSDMLGGSGDADEPRATTASAPPPADPIPEPEPEPEAEPEPEPEHLDDSAIESPQEVLDRLTQYATSTRAAEATAPESSDDPEPAAADVDPTRGDDFLPRGKSATRKPSRRNKRRP